MKDNTAFFLVCFCTLNVTLLCSLPFSFTVVLDLLKEAYQKIIIACLKDNDNYFQLEIEPASGL